MAYTLYNLTGSAMSTFNTSAPGLSVQDIFSSSLSSYSYHSPSLSSYLSLPVLFPSRYSGLTLAVFLEACDSIGAQNCTTCCLDTSVMFDSLETFHNCLIYTAVARLNAQGRLNDAHLTDSLGIDNGRPANQTAQNVTTLIFNCLFDYCGYNSKCKTDLQGYTASSYINETHAVHLGNFRSYHSILDFDICSYVAPFSFLNADVGGVGVSIKTS